MSPPSLTPLSPFHPRDLKSKSLEPREVERRGFSSGWLSHGPGHQAEASPGTITAMAKQPATEV